MDSLLEKVRERITPTAEEDRLEQEIVSEINSLLEKKGVRPILVGSLAKKTDLRADKDIDIFLRFPPETSREDLKESGLRVGKEVFKHLSAEYEVDYAEHPYVKGQYKGYVVELVPCYDTKKPKSAVDRTPFHTRYVRDRIRENKNLAGEIRLLKQFMKGAGVYGAEAKVEGFSGYLTELIVINYGSFTEALKAVSAWKFKEVLDPGSLWDDSRGLKYFFPEASLVVVDPTDENRNVAAAVSRQILAEFIVAAAAFLKSPSESYFFPEPPAVPEREDLKARFSSRDSRLCAFVFRHGKINPNTLYSQLRKTCTALEKSVESEGFRVLKHGFWTDELETSLIVLELEVWLLSKVKSHLGPLIDSNSRDQEKFIEKYAAFKPYIADGRWVVDAKRRFSEVESFLPVLASEKSGFGKDLRKLEDASVLFGDAVMDFGDDDFLVFLDSFLSKI